MKKNIFVVWLLSVLMHTIPNLAADAPETAREIITQSLIQGNIRFASYNYFTNQSSSTLSSSKMLFQISQANGTKSVAKAVVYSSAIPGTGQIYTGSYIKGFVFLIIEAASLTGYFHYNNRGNNLETGFERYADQNWNEDVYWNWVNDKCQMETDPNWSGPCSSNPVTDREPLREYEKWRSDFTHSLPGEKNQQYYENIGKYDQFNIGWSDAKEGNVADSALREDYTLMRKDANDNFKLATNLITVTLFNHVASAFDAGFTAKRFNRRVVEARLRLKSMLYNNQIIPAIRIGILW